MFLFINTTVDNNLTVALYTKSGEEKILKTVPISRTESEVLLPTIDAVLKSSGIKKPAGIIVVCGQEGRFSAIRTGVVCANSLAFGWNVPVFGIIQGDDIRTAIDEIKNESAFSKPVVPVYSKEPNIR
jgi:tRNA A37 threonylcarbamoyladenosine modification protein TsaB